MSCEIEEPDGAIRVSAMDGYLERKNDIIYHLPACKEITGTVVFFGGDIQDYKENMIAHRDNQHYSEWDLESTSVLLHQNFPDKVVVIIKPSKMSLKTFSCYENFVDVNNFGAPSYSTDTNSLMHLKLLLLNLFTVHLNKYSSILAYKKMTLIGFSKGCVVLNQLLYSIHALQNEFVPELIDFLSNISDIYWIDGGHSGPSPTWVTDRAVLESFSKYNINIHIHVTPYQVQCDTRPKIRKEEKIFRETLNKLGAKIHRKLHFESEPRSLEFHFKVLECFHEHD